MSADTMQQQDAPEQQAQPRARTFFFPFPGVVVQLTFVGDNSSAAPNPTLADLAAMLFASSGEGFDPSRFFETNGHFGTPPASAKAVEALPEIDLTESDVESKPSCSVCLEDHIAGTKALRLPCTHLFHKECVMPWLQQHNSCPSCRFELPTDDSQYEARKRQQQSPPAEQHQEQQDGDGSNAEQGTAEGQQQQQPPLRRRRVDDVHGQRAQHHYHYHPRAYFTPQPAANQQQSQSQEPQRLSIAFMRRHLHCRGIDTTGLLERSDFIQRYRESLGVREMQQLLQHYGVAWQDCVERRELVERVNALNL